MSRKHEVLKMSRKHVLLINAIDVIEEIPEYLLVPPGHTGARGQVTIPEALALYWGINVQSVGDYIAGDRQFVHRHIELVYDNGDPLRLEEELYACDGRDRVVAHLHELLAERAE